MRKVVNRLLYDTTQAKELGDVSARGVAKGDPAWEETKLYRTPKGRFFIAGKGNAHSRWGTLAGPNVWAAGEGIFPLTVDEAKHIAEQSLTAEQILKIWPDSFEAA